MANKFTKSVLERQEKEYRESTKKKQPPQEGVPEIETQSSTEVTHGAKITSTEQFLSKNSLLQREPPLYTKQTPPKPDEEPLEVQEIEPAVVLQHKSLSLNDFIIQKESRNAKNKTFYLDTAVIQAIKRAASTQKVTESKLVNDILKKILGAV